MAKEKSAPRTPVLRYPHIASRVFDTPLLIEHSKLVAILHVLGPRLGFDGPMFELDSPCTADLAKAAGDPLRHLDMLVKASRLERRDEGHYVADGVAVIPVVGTLVQRADWMDAMSGMVGYGQIERMFVAAIDDPTVKEILLEIDSPGGEVAGAFDMADRMYEARGQKPMTAIATELAASAAYLIASAADEIVVPRTGSVGSIGVVATHVDYSKALDKRGIAVTLIYAGEKKVDGNPFAALPAGVRAEWQAEVDEVYQLFVSTVARNRGLEEDWVRKTEAGMFMGHTAKDSGLADRVNTFDNELSNSALRAKQAGAFFLNQQQKESQMKTEMEKRAEAEAEAKLRAEAEAKAKAEQEAKAKADAEAKAKTDAEAKARQDAEAKARSGAASDRDRVKAILGCEEAKGREQMAQHLALETDLTLEQAKGVLAKSPKASKLDEAMQHFGPGVKSEEVTDLKPTTIDSPAAMFERRAQIFQGARAK
jgi:signal peptide peptidase SppA